VQLLEHMVGEAVGTMEGEGQVHQRAVEVAREVS
jgi:hypothetical protein